MKLLLVLAICSSVAGCVSLPGTSCPIPGEAVQWQADYCLLATGTDDLIAAQPCIDREAENHFQTVCAEKQHYKARMCILVTDAGSRSGTADQCIQDPNFSGPIVRNGGAQ